MSYIIYKTLFEFVGISIIIFVGIYNLTMGLARLNESWKSQERDENSVNILDHE